MNSAPLGKTGVRVSKLFLGTGSDDDGFIIPKQARVKPEAFLSILRRAYEAGVYFWDTAERYRTYEHLSLGIREFPRGTLVISSKTAHLLANEVRGRLRKALDALGTDYLDLYLAHAVDRPDQYRLLLDDGLAAFHEAKQAGLIRAVGLSTHNSGILERAVGEGVVDVVFTNFNKFGIHMDASVSRYEAILERARAVGIGVLVHKTLGEGKLVETHYKETLAYNLSAPFIDAVCVGIAGLDELERALVEAGEILSRPQSPAGKRSADL